MRPRNGNVSLFAQHYFFICRHYLWCGRVNNLGDCLCSSCAWAIRGEWWCVITHTDWMTTINKIWGNINLTQIFIISLSLSDRTFTIWLECVELLLMLFLGWWPGMSGWWLVLMRREGVFSVAIQASFPLCEPILKLNWKFRSFTTVETLIIICH